MSGTDTFFDLRFLRFRFALVVSLILISHGILVSCGGGGNTSDATGANGAAAATGSSATGYAVFSVAGSKVRIVDLSNFTAADLPIANSIWPSYDGVEWATFDTKRRYSDNEDDLQIFDASGKLRSTTPVRKSLHGRVQVSPDRTKYGIYWADEINGESYTDSNFTIFDRDIKILYRNFAATSFTWFPNGDILYSESKNLYRAGPTGQNPKLIAVLPGNPAGLTVSRTGTKIAFSLVGPRPDEAHTYAMNADGSNIHQVTTSNYTDIDPTWVGSDDKFMLIREMVSADIQGPNGCPALYLVPTDAGRVLNLSKAFADPAIVKVLNKTPKDPLFFDACPFSQVAWVPR